MKLPPGLAVGVRLSAFDFVPFKPDPDGGDGKAYFGAWVTLEDEDGEQVQYQIVGPDEFDVEGGRISMDSPVGKALLGKSEGDEVTVKRPKGDAVFEVVEVRYES